MRLKEFVFSLEGSKMQATLARTIKGKGAFGRFHAAIQAYKIQDQWYKYQKDRLHEIVVEWCHQNKLAYKLEESVSPAVGRNRYLV